MNLRQLSIVIAVFFVNTTYVSHASGPLNIGGSNNNTPVTYPNQGRNIVINLDQGALGTRSQKKIVTLIKNSFNLWNQVNTSTANISIGKALPLNVTSRNFRNYLGKFSDGIMPIIFDSDGSIVDAMFGVGAKRSILGFAGSGYNPRNATYSEGQAIINGAISVSDTRLVLVLAHELGHLLGVDHTQLDNTQGLTRSNYPVMYPKSLRNTVSLHPDDIAAITELYPSTNAATTLGTLSGLFLTQFNQTILGANIWVKDINTHQVYSKVSDYLKQNNGYFDFQLPPGQYELHGESIQSGFTGASSIGPYANSSRAASFTKPHPITPVTYNGNNATPVIIQISKGCRVEVNFLIDGSGNQTSSNCLTNSPKPTPSPTNTAPIISLAQATPPTLKDNQQTQLSVTANDADNGPNPLKYQWIVPTGKGQINNSTNKIATYIPPTVNTKTTVTVRIEVNDGKDTTRKDLSLAIEPSATNKPPQSTLLSETFNTTTFPANWSIVNDGRKTKTSKWQVTSAGMTQTSNYSASNRPHYLGTYLLYDKGSTWQNYALSLDLTSNDNDGIGVMFHVRDHNTYYRFSWNRQSSRRTLSLHDNGKVIVLAEDRVAYTQRQTYQVDIRVENAQINVIIDGKNIFSVNNNVIDQGSIALYSWMNQGSVFDNVKVSALSATPTPTIAPEPTTTPAPKPTPPPSGSSIFSEDFSSSDSSQWSIVDEGNISAPSSWEIAKGELIQKRNIYHRKQPDNLGTYAIYQNGYAWSDYQLQATIKSDDNDAIGVMFRVIDRNNYYRFSWNKQHKQRRLTRHKDGQVSIIAQDSQAYITRQTYQLTILVQGDTIEVKIDNTVIFTTHDNTHRTGSIAMYSWMNQGSHFDNITVTTP